MCSHYGKDGCSLGCSSASSASVPLALRNPKPRRRAAARAVLLGWAATVRDTLMSFTDRLSKVLILFIM